MEISTNTTHSEIHSAPRRICQVFTKRRWFEHIPASVHEMKTSYQWPSLLHIYRYSNEYSSTLLHSNRYSGIEPGHRQSEAFTTDGNHTSSIR